MINKIDLTIMQVNQDPGDIIGLLAEIEMNGLRHGIVVTGMFLFSQQ
jgi:hypothetical protein